MQRTFVALVIATAACSSGPRGASEPVAAEPDRASPVDADADAEPDAVIDDVAAPGQTITRAALLPVLDAGPGMFLSTVKVEAFFRAQRFVGWKVLALDARYGEAGIEPGDILVSANGIAVSKPEHLSDVFEKLRGADQLVLAGERSGAPLELVFGIEGAPPPPAPAAGQK